VDEAFVAERSPHALSITLGSEAVVVDAHSHLVHTLNPTAAVLWACLDGVSTLGEICADVADAADAAYDTVRRDALALVQQLLASGVVRRPGAVAQPIPAQRAAETSAPLSADTAVGVQVAGQVARLACTDAEVAEWLRRALAPHVVSDSPSRGMPTSMTLQLVTRSGPGRVLMLHLLRRDGRTVLATPGRARLLRATLAHLDSLSHSPDELCWKGRASSVPTAWSS
jgi:hypothetical protein